MPRAKKKEAPSAVTLKLKNSGTREWRASPSSSSVFIPADVNLDFVPLPMPGRTESPTEVLDRSLVFNLVTLTNRIASENSRILLGTYGIGVALFQTLRYMRLDSETTPARICAVTTMDKSVVSRSLQALAEKGLVISRIDPTDSRRQFWTLTPSGISVVDEVMTGSLTRQRMLLSGFEDEEIRTLYSLLKRVKSNVHKMRDAAPLAEAGRKQAKKKGKRRS